MLADRHVHWNVTGPNFIAVHTMLDAQVDAVRAMVDETAERIAALGGSPCGTPGALAARRDWDDYSIGRAGTLEHLGALDVVYAGIIEAHRRDRRHRGSRPGRGADAISHWPMRQAQARAQPDEGDEEDRDPADGHGAPGLEARPRHVARSVRN